MTRLSLGCFVVVAFFLAPAWTAAEPPSVDKAKAEKEVTLYGSTNASIMQKVIQGFEKKYPFLKVNYARTRGDKVMQRTVTEQRAGRYLADVINVKGSFIYWLKTQGVFDRYESPERRYVRDLHKDKDALYTGVYTNFEFVGSTRNSFPRRSCRKVRRICSIRSGRARWRWIPGTTSGTSARCTCSERTTRAGNT